MTASNHVLFCLSYRHNRPSLRRKAYFSIKWKLRFHDPRKKIVKRVRDKAQDEKMRRTITETDNGRNFLFTKFSVVDFFLIVKRNIFMYTAKIGLWQISQLSIFVFSRKKYHYLGQVRNFRFLFSYFVLLPPLGILNDTVCYEYDFFCALSSH